MGVPRGEPRRVLMLSWEFPPRLVGGIARHVDELSRALARQGVEVDVVTAHHPGAPDREVVAEFPGEAGWGGGRVRVLRAGPAPVNPLDFIVEIDHLNFGLLEKLLEEGSFGYDVIHAHEWLVALAGRTLKHGLGLPLVGTIHGTEWGRNGGIHNALQHYIHSVEWLLTYEAARVICCSRFMENEVIEALKVPRDKLHVVPNGVDPERVRCRATPAELAGFRSRWALPGERIVFFVGRLVREKGLEVLIDAIPHVLAAHPDAKFVIAGGGWHGHLWERAAALGVGEKVVFTGFVAEADLPRLYALAEVAVFPSVYEPFGIVALEAMAAGVPVVTSDIGGFREVVRHGETGIHTWANNPESLAWGINLVLSDGALARRLREAGKREVEARYRWGAIAEQTLQIYREAMSGAVAQGPAAPAPAVWEPSAATGPGVRPRYLAAETGQRS